jgi:dolichyl-phosphate-mannose-protein mannosyltransferase
VRRRLVVVAVVVVLALSAGVRLYHLGTPKSYIFDEVYYAKDARTILKANVGPTDKTFPWEPGKEVSWPHPEWGKFLIAGGILLFGDNAFGWRIMSAVAGLVMVAAVYPLARRLGLSPTWALLALTLAAADTLSITQSRIATLDIFVGVWTVLCLWFALRYAQDGHRLRWLVLCGLAGGLALGTKWSGAYTLLAALVLLFLLRKRDRAEPQTGTWQRALRAGRAALAPLALLVLVPLVLYVASYWEYFLTGHTFAQWRELQRQMLEFNLHLHAPHTYASTAPTWIADYRPVWYYFVSKNEVVRGVVSIGNAFLWWSALACLLVLPFVALLRRRRGLVTAPLLVALLYFPWFVETRTSFMFYMTPVAPFMAVLVATAFAAASGVEVRLPEHPPWDLSLEEGWPRGGTGEEPTTARDRTVGPERPGLVPTEDVGAHGSPDGKARVGWVLPAQGDLWPILLFAVGLAVMTLFWYRIGRAVDVLFWTLPGAALVGERLAHLQHELLVAVQDSHGPGRLAWTVAGVVVVLAIVLLIAVFTLRLPRRLWRQLLLLWSGAIVGWAVVFLPIVLALAISSAHFYRLMWFGSWI